MLVLLLTLLLSLDPIVESLSDTSTILGPGVTIDPALPVFRCRGGAEGRVLPPPVVVLMVIGARRKRYEDLLEEICEIGA